MQIHITMDHAATWGAEFLLSRQRISDQRRQQIMPATKYNLLVKTFNVSSVLLVAAAVFALFLAISSAFVFLAAGMFLRYTAEKELEKYTIPFPPQGWNAIAQVVQMHFLRHALNQTTDVEKVANIHRRVNMEPQENWDQVEVKFLDFDLWRNTIEIPEVVEQQPQQGNENAPGNRANEASHQQPGMLANLFGMVVGQRNQAQSQPPPVG